MEHVPHPPQPENETALFARRQQEQLEREAYPRRHWEHGRDAYAGMHRRLTAGVGPWEYDSELYTVTHRSRRYQIDLEQLTTPAELLDVLLQVATKSAGKSDALGALVALLEAIGEEVFQTYLARGLLSGRSSPHCPVAQGTGRGGKRGRRPLVLLPRCQKAAKSMGPRSKRLSVWSTPLIFVHLLLDAL